ncbi:MAG: DUF1559 domain-containing protein, partial [Planctomycetota bacterium]
QIGLAIQNYESAFRRLPSGRRREFRSGEGRCFSAYAALLPYLEAQSLYERIDFSRNPDDPAANGVALSQTIPFFLCPSDSFQILQRNVVAGAIIDSAVHNYPLNTGTTYPLSPRNPRRVPVTGVFFENSSLSTASISDGLSQTICISETVKSEGGPSVWDGKSKTNGFVLTRGNDNETNGPELTDIDSQCQGAGLRLQQTRGSRWLYGAPGHSMYNHMRRPNDPNVDCRGGLPHSIRTNHWWDRLSLNVAARSRHPGGVQALFLDGHVSFVNDDIDMQTWKACGSRNGCESSEFER